MWCLDHSNSIQKKEKAASKLGARNKIFLFEPGYCAATTHGKQQTFPDLERLATHQPFSSMCNCNCNFPAETAVLDPLFQRYVVRKSCFHFNLEAEEPTGSSPRNQEKETGCRKIRVTVACVVLHGLHAAEDALRAKVNLLTRNKLIFVDERSKRMWVASIESALWRSAHEGCGAERGAFRVVSFAWFLLPSKLLSFHLTHHVHQVSFCTWTANYPRDLPQPQRKNLRDERHSFFCFLAASEQTSKVISAPCTGNEKKW